MSNTLTAVDVNRSIIDAHPQATKWRGTVTVPPSMCDFTDPPPAP